MPFSLDVLAEKQLNVGTQRLVVRSQDSGPRIHGDGYVRPFVNRLLESASGNMNKVEGRYRRGGGQKTVYRCGSIFCSGERRKYEKTDGNDTMLKAEAGRGAMRRLGAALCCLLLCWPGAASRVVATRQGKLQGELLRATAHAPRDVERYLGVPYAWPPLGAARFGPTRAPAPWDGVRGAATPGPACPQRVPDLRREAAALLTMSAARLRQLRRLLPFVRRQSEDCLYLNTTRLPTKVNRARFSVGPLPDIRMWESCLTMPLVSGFSRGSPVFPTLEFRRCFILTSLHPQQLSRPRSQSPRAKSVVTRPGIEPGSPWWEASRANRSATVASVIVMLAEEQLSFGTLRMLLRSRSADYGDARGNHLVSPAGSVAHEGVAGTGDRDYRLGREEGERNQTRSSYSPLREAYGDYRFVPAIDVSPQYGHALDDCAPIADLQGNKKLIPYCQMWGDTGATANEQPSEVRLYKGLWSLAYSVNVTSLDPEFRTSTPRGTAEYRHGHYGCRHVHSPVRLCSNSSGRDRGENKPALKFVPGAHGDNPGTAVAERSARSPPTNANRVQSPARSLPDFPICGDPAVTMPLVRGGIFTPAPPPHSSAAPYSPLITLIGSQDRALRFVGQEARERYGRQLQARLAPHRSYVQDVQCFGLPAEGWRDFMAICGLLDNFVTPLAQTRRKLYAKITEDAGLAPCTVVSSEFSTFRAHGKTPLQYQARHAVRCKLHV
ncbi:hypothetical protein PR048_027280 [Dryococelus australis]|uniref:Carboxylesterase type B domain-containing protein n=1 Tax=Dryococelus australis TaxID=614101 RepID=A0ABQ9GF78_9NEOP|nr:hypothetical protein PR048_027280 [Dryococelus australis]